MPFVRNCWYPAAWVRDLETQPVARVILGEKIVLFRTANGDPAALEDRCPHRLLPLSQGQVTGGGLQCGYHGLTFDGGGACVAAPTQGNVPDTVVRSYPVAEQLGLVWIWMGDPDKADKTDIYDLPQYHDPAWGVAHGDALYVDANYLLLCDNLCDPTHVNYVHPTTLGSPDIADTPVNYEERDWGVRTSRWTPDSEPVGFFKAFGDFDSTVDRWQIYDMHVPSTAIIDLGSAAAGTGAQDGAGDGRIQVFSCHFMTPVTETTCIDYWLHVRNFQPDNPSIGEGISEQFRIAFAEDKVILENIQIEEERFAEEADGTKRIGLDLDASAGLFRHLVTQRIRVNS
ncbi:MAG: aromatic ring-hydroxylating dioxygenase subunit alpha [Rhodospirillaceae bacterium]|nr:aromatic ring-hydroxylating dioxygenase subunit alpha [Rhodospirillaceae bacterium]